MVKRDNKPVTRVGLLIKAEMEHRGWTQKQVGEFIGVEQPNVNKWLKNAQAPHRRYIPRISEFLGVDTDTVSRAIDQQTQTDSERLDALEAMLTRLAERVETLAAKRAR